MNILEKLELSKFRHPRYSRRIHSKSQPSGSMSFDSERTITEMSQIEENVFEDTSVVRTANA